MRLVEAGTRGFASLFLRHAVFAVSLLAACGNAALLRDSPALRLRGGQDASPASVVIRKPEIDKREYRHVVLPNKLQAVLVSDKSAYAGAAALCVAAGQLDDPPEVFPPPRNLVRRYAPCRNESQHRLIQGRVGGGEGKCHQAVLHAMKNFAADLPASTHLLRKRIS